MTLSDIPEERKAQLTAIDITLATAPKIQEDLKAKFGYGENKFFDLDLVEYRINNSLLDIAEDLDVKNRYGLLSDKSLEPTISMTFRGHHNEDFKSDHQFDGLFSKETNDYIETIRNEIGGRKAYELGEGIHAQTLEEKSELGRKAYELGEGIHGLTPEERYKHSRKGGLASRGKGYWQTHPELLEEICELRKELTWKETTAEMNEKYGEDYTTTQVKKAYQNNKHRLNDEEE